MCMLQLTSLYQRHTCHPHYFTSSRLILTIVYLCTLLCLKMTILRTCLCATLFRHRRLPLSFHSHHHLKFQTLQLNPPSSCTRPIHSGLQSLKTLPITYSSKRFYLSHSTTFPFSPFPSVGPYTTITYILNL